MAHLWLLLTLRLKLSARRWSGQRGMLVAMALGLSMMGVLSWLIASALVGQHARLETELSERLLDLTALLVAVFLVVSPLMGFRGNEHMDVTKLFHYPVRPLWVFVSTTTGSFFSGTSLFVLPILLLPAWAVAGGLENCVEVTVASLVYVFLLYAIVQCIVLSLLNVLRSRRFSDLAAVLAPVVGIGTYLGLRMLIVPSPGESAPEALTAILEGVDLSRFTSWLPPLWFSRSLRAAEPERLLRMAALAALALGSCALGVRLTLLAFHGEIAISAGEKEVRARAGIVRRVVVALLPARIGALYEKELTVLKREPWFRMLFIQQLGIVVIILLGTALWNDHQVEVGTSIYGAGFALVFVETGFLLNCLGLEGSSIEHTARLPLGSFRLLLGKNLAYLHVLAVTNLVILPAMALLYSAVHGIAFPLEPVLLLIAIDVGVLPVLIGAGNLVSVFLPARVGRRGKRALGQDRAGNEGCVGSMLRGVFSVAALLPAIGVGLVIAIPVLTGSSLLSGMGALCTVLGLLFSVGLYALLTLPAAQRLQRDFAKIVARLG